MSSMFWINRLPHKHCFSASIFAGPLLEPLFPDSLVFYQHLAQLDFQIHWNPLVLLLQLFLEALYSFNFFAKRCNWKVTIISALLESGKTMDLKWTQNCVDYYQFLDGVYLTDLD